MKIYFKEGPSLARVYNIIFKKKFSTIVYTSMKLVFCIFLVLFALKLNILLNLIAFLLSGVWKGLEMVRMQKDKCRGNENGAFGSNQPKAVIYHGHKCFY